MHRISKKSPGKDSKAVANDGPVQKSTSKTGLPDNLKSGVEQLSGYDLSHINVHFNSPQPAQLNAHAYAQGSDIHLAPGQEKHLPHESWHVVQQMEGRVKPTMHTSGVAVNDSAALEKEADTMGSKAATTQLKSNDEEEELKIGKPAAKAVQKKNSSSGGSK